MLLSGTRDSDAVRRKFTYIMPSGNTALYDAVSLGLKHVRRGSRPRKFLLLISDGEDNNSRSTFRDIKNQLKESDVTVYAVGVGGYSFRKGLSGSGILEELTTVTGGRAYFADKVVEMDEAFEQIGLEMRHLYSIGYYPADFALDGKWHLLKIKLSIPTVSSRLFIRSRKGYYAEIK